MIKLVKSGKYTLYETKTNIKILQLDRIAYVWLKIEGIGEVLVISHNQHRRDDILSTNEYKLYSVKNEKNLVDLQHLELKVGEDMWQGYLLLTGLPNDKHLRARVVPTKEVITKKRTASAKQ